MAEWTKTNNKEENRYLRYLRNISIEIKAHRERINSEIMRNVYKNMIKKRQFVDSRQAQLIIVTRIHITHAHGTRFTKKIKKLIPV